MQRSRTGPPTTSSETGVASLPQGLPALEVLIQQARAPDAARAEVDELIAGLAQPLPPEHSPRERADLLLALIDDKHLGDFTGSRGQTVRSAAVQALMGLGYPYALEVPPDALEPRSGREERAGQDSPGRVFAGGAGWAGFCIVMLLGLLQLIPTLMITDSFARSSDRWLGLVAVLLIAGSSFLPASLVALGHAFKSRLLRGLGGVLLVIAGLVWLFPGLFMLYHTAAGLIPIAVGVLYFVSVALMDSVAPD
ncbi:MAG TPA: hypothetical protein VK539_21120 [Myxococcaceae bacterium]|nr:hypothetical protein [Myxococcaceae bacterium]